MNELNNRIDTQRAVLKLVNGSHKYHESLLSLSSQAINRWASDNRIGQDCKEVELLMKISGRLFFLANKSQEQVTEEYGKLSDRVNNTINLLSEELNRVG